MTAPAPATGFHEAYCNVFKGSALCNCYFGGQDTSLPAAPSPSDPRDDDLVREANIKLRRLSGHGLGSDLIQRLRDRIVEQDHTIRGQDAAIDSLSAQLAGSDKPTRAHDMKQFYQDDPPNADGPSAEEVQDCLHWLRLAGGRVKAARDDVLDRKLAYSAADLIDRLTTRVKDQAEEIAALIKKNKDVQR